MFNQVEFNKLTAGEQSLVMWQYHMEGGFMSTLWELLVRADRENLARLELAFPSHVKAFRNYSQVHGWWEGIQDRLKKPNLEVIQGDD